MDEIKEKVRQLDDLLGQDKKRLIRRGRTLSRSVNLGCMHVLISLSFSLRLWRIFGLCSEEEATQIQGDFEGVEDQEQLHLLQFPHPSLQTRQRLSPSLVFDVEPALVPEKHENS